MSSNKTPEPYQAALYARRKFTDVIAKDEPNPTASAQIKETKTFLSEYDDIKVAGIYMDSQKLKQDDPRPEFYRLVKDLKAGQYNCLVITSFELFTKDHMEAKYYVLNLFAVMNIRILSIQDNYDSLYSESSPQSHERLEELVTQIDHYSRSRILSNQALKKKNDAILEFTFTPYGYLYNPDNPCFLDIDEETVENVRFIFKEYLSGTNINQIARQLTEKGVASPSLRKEQLGMQYRHPNAKDYWTHGGVRSILTNQMYTGDLVIGNNRSAQYVFRDNKRHPYLLGEIVPDHHEAIISRKDFKRANMMMNLLTKKRQEIQAERPQPQLPPTPFVNTVYCGVCGRSMYHVRYNTSSRHPYSIYICSSHRQKLESPCPLYHFRLDEIIPVVKEHLLQERSEALDIAKQMEQGEESPLYQKIGNYFQKQVEIIMEKVQENVSAINLIPIEDSENRTILEDEATSLRTDLLAVLDEKKKFRKEFTLNNQWLDIFSHLPEEFELTKQYARKLVERIELTPDKPLTFFPKYGKEKALLHHYITISQEVDYGKKEQTNYPDSESE